MPSSSTWSPLNSVRTGRVWSPRCSTPGRPSCSTIAGPAPARTWQRSGCSTTTRSTPIGRASRSGSRAPDTLSPLRPVGGRARPWPQAAPSTRRCSAGSPLARRIPARAATPTRSPSSPARQRVRSPHRWWPSCSTAVRRSSRRRPSSTTTDWRSTAPSTATTPASAPSCGWSRPTWRPTPTSTRWFHGSAASRPKPLGRNRFTSKMRRPRPCCSRSRRPVSPGTFPRPAPGPKWR